MNTEKAATYRQAVIGAEAQEHEGGYTLGAFNRREHDLIRSSMTNSNLSEVETGHLMYRKGFGVRKIGERDCLLCIDLDLNGGDWRMLNGD
jgi:hypothetical protein